MKAMEHRDADAKGLDFDQIMRTYEMTGSIDTQRKEFEEFT